MYGHWRKQGLARNSRLFQNESHGILAIADGIKIEVERWREGYHPRLYELSLHVEQGLVYVLCVAPICVLTPWSLVALFLLCLLCFLMKRFVNTFCVLYYNHLVWNLVKLNHAIDVLNAMLVYHLLMLKYLMHTVGMYMFLSNNY